MYPALYLTIAAPAPFLFIAAADAPTVTAWAAILTGIASVIASVAVLIGQMRTHREVAAVRETAQEVKAVVQDVQAQTSTLNGSTLAQLGDAAETRRIDLIHPDERTAAESSHVANVSREGKTP